MLKSMTAYGRSHLSTSAGRFVAEIQSVNRKHLEILLLLPKELSRFDSDIRKLIANTVTRGQVTVRMQAAFEGKSPVTVTANLPLARQLKKAWESIAKEWGIELRSEVLGQLLATQEDLLCYDEELGDEKLYREGVLDVIRGALVGFEAMREREGQVLQRDMATRLELLSQSVAEVGKHAGDTTAKYREKLKSRLEEVLPGGVENEERLLREVCLFAERMDISEEIVRFNSHLKQMVFLLNSIERGVGKSLEFLVQELNREANTMGAKSSDATISQLVVTIKSELEKVREQLQNVE